MTTAAHQYTAPKTTKDASTGLIWALMAAMFVIGLDIFIVSPVLHAIATTFAVQPAQVGLLVTAFALPYGGLSLVFGPISDRLGRRRVLLAALPIFTLASAGTALAPSFSLLLLARAVAGAAASAFTPNLYALLGDVVPPAQRPRAMGIVLSGATIGMIFGVPVGSWLADATSWRGSFWLVTALAVAVLAVLAFVVPRSSPAHAATGQKGAYRQALAVAGAVPALCTSALWFGLATGFYTFIGELLKLRYGLSETSTGLVLASFGIANTLGSFCTAWFVRWLGATRYAVMLAISVILLALLTISLVSTLPLAGFIAVASVWYFSMGFGLPAQQSLLSTLGGHLRGTVMSLGSSAMYLGLMAAAAAESWAWHRGGAVATGLLAAAGLLLSIFTEARVREAQVAPANAAD